MVTIKVGRRGQITIPSHIRRQIGIQEGDRIVLLPQKDQVLLLPVTKSLLDIRGSVPVSSAQDFSAIRAKVITARAEEIAHDGN